MILLSIDELKSNLPKGTSILGLDLGSRTIGLAISDPTCLIASPLKTLQRHKFSDDARALDEIINSNNVGGLVVGLPVTMAGTEGARCQSTRQFVANFQSHRKIGITFWDERLSTVAVERILINEADMTRQKRRLVIDKMAATYILQGALDSLSTNKFG